MKIAPQRIEAFLASPPAAIRAVLVYGADAGLVHERLQRLTRTVVPDPSDPFRVAELPATLLREDPARLSDEAASYAMTKDRRVVRVREAGDGVTKTIERYLAAPTGDTLILVDAGELPPRSSLRKLFEGATEAAALPCYTDSESSLAGVIREEISRHHLSTDADVLSFLAENLGGDRMLTRSEIGKLALYMGSETRVTLKDATACIGDGSALSLDDLVAAAAGGNQVASQKMLLRLLREGTSPIAILRVLSRHVQRLHLLCGLLAQGSGIDQALATFRPPLHFRVADRLKRQAPHWSADRLAQALELIAEAEEGCKRTGAPAEEICGRLLMRLATAARRR